ncbi:MAG: hypothetical protein DCF25_16595 [Leptolyngbya foveolarum]|uniref:YbjN domain-containing protein n=1 Tax=Leptolyngbya foveolarum TaxID=47253 RepID=A0A2W4TWF4_9CYAN|nr:MAG: hypothetical protein DCF25_16595 [Leptolyngbya foveolarum]
MKLPILRSDLSLNAEPTALTHRCDADVHDEAFSINCLLRTVRVEESACLLSKINYCFPATPAVSISTAMRHADCLNRLLSQSKAYVVEDIDGDHGYFLQLDSVLQGDTHQEQVSTFLAGVTQDLEIMLKYFQLEAHKPRSESLSTVSEGCNTASLQTKVSMVASL